MEIIGGEFPKRANALVLEWASEHRAELFEDWNRAKEQKELIKIEPLK